MSSAGRQVILLAAAGGQRRHSAPRRGRELAGGNWPEASMTVRRWRSVAALRPDGGATAVESSRGAGLIGRAHYFIGPRDWSFSAGTVLLSGVEAYT